MGISPTRRECGSHSRQLAPERARVRVVASGPGVNPALGSQSFDSLRLIAGKIYIPGFHKNLKAAPKFRFSELGVDEGAVTGQGYPSGKLVVVEQGRNLVEVRDKRFVSIKNCVVVALRHTFVTKAWETKAAANVVMNLARHKDITTTLRYTHKDQQAQIQAINAMTPPKKKLG